MKLIAGLGNPGAKYQNNRHNLGFMVADSFVKNQGFSWRYSADLLCYFLKSGDLVVVKPTTFMNKSGETIRATANFYKISLRDILIIHDDLDLPFGKIRLSYGGSAAGHHGVESVIESLGMPDFARLRVGVSSPRFPTSDNKPVSPEDYVLSDFGKEEQKQLGEIIRRCEQAIKSYLDLGLEATMNKFN